MNPYLIQVKEDHIEPNITNLDTIEPTMANLERITDQSVLEDMVSYPSLTHANKFEKILDYFITSEKIKMEFYCQ